ASSKRSTSVPTAPMPDAPAASPASRCWSARPTICSWPCGARRWWATSCWTSRPATMPAPWGSWCGPATGASKNSRSGARRTARSPMLCATTCRRPWSGFSSAERPAKLERAGGCAQPARGSAVGLQLEPVARVAPDRKIEHDVAAHARLVGRDPVPAHEVLKACGIDALLAPLELERRPQVAELNGREHVVLAAGGRGHGQLQPGATSCEEDPHDRDQHDQLPQHRASRPVAL